MSGDNNNSLPMVVLGTAFVGYVAGTLGRSIFSVGGGLDKVAAEMARFTDSMKPPAEEAAAAFTTTSRGVVAIGNAREPAAADAPVAASEVRPRAEGALLQDNLCRTRCCCAVKVRFAMPCLYAAASASASASASSCTAQSVFSPSSPLLLPTRSQPALCPECGKAHGEVHAGKPGSIPFEQSAPVLPT